MKRARFWFAAAVAMAAAIALLGSQGSLAETKEYVSKAKATTLHQAPVPGLEEKEVIIKHFELPPGYVGGRHYHPGPVYVYVLKGVFTIETEEGTQTYKAGEIYPEPINRTMQVKNLNASEELEFVVFQIGEIGKPMMIKAE